MLLSNLLLQQKKSLLHEKESIEKQLKQFPAGKLSCNKNVSKSKTYSKWYLTLPDEQNPGKRKRTYISKSNRHLANLLFLKQICELRLKEISIELIAIEAYLKKHREDKTLDHLLLAPHYQDLLDDQSAKKLMKILSRPYLSAAIHLQQDLPENFSRKTNKRVNTSEQSPLLRQQQLSLQNELAAWAAADYPMNPYYLDKKTIPAVNGLIVRSKAEAIIALILSINHIPFRYDALLSIGGYEYYPDFTIRHPITGAIYYWEHVGMLDKTDYVADYLKKLRVYLNNGLYPDVNLIMTYETDSNAIDSEIVIDKIREFFL